MLKHQILITFAIIIFALWIAVTIRDRRRSKDDNEENPNE